MTSNKHSDDGLRQRAEKSVQKKTPPSSVDLKALSPEEIRQKLHELQVHQVELEFQNDALCQSQTELNATKDRYFELYDQAPVGYCTLSKKGLVLEANLTAATLLGLPRDMLVRRPLARFILKEDRVIYYLHSRQLLETGEPQGCELRLLRGDGTKFWAQLDANIGRGSTKRSDQDDADIPEYRIVLTDITKHKRVKTELRESEERFRLI